MRAHTTRGISAVIALDFLFVRTALLFIFQISYRDDKIRQLEEDLSRSQTEHHECYDQVRTGGARVGRRLRPPPKGRVTHRFVKRKWVILLPTEEFLEGWAFFARGGGGRSNARVWRRTFCHL